MNAACRAWTSLPASGKRALKALCGCRVCSQAARCPLIEGIRAGLARAAADVLREKRGERGNG